MATTNKKKRNASHLHDYKAPRLAGGMGNIPAKQSLSAELQRLVYTCLLWENNAYISGVSVAERIAELSTTLPAEDVRDIAIKAVTEQKLRHVPLWIAMNMFENKYSRSYAKEILDVAFRRPDQLTEFAAMYWTKNPGKRLPHKATDAMSEALNKFDGYQLAKYSGGSKEVKLRDVLRLARPTPISQEQSVLFKQLNDGTLPSPNTWEVRYSACRTEQEKKSVWTDLINDNKLGALAFLRNLRNMQQVGVNSKTIRNGLANLKPHLILPVQFMQAAQYAPDYTDEIEQLMFSCTSQHKKLAGDTIFVLDVSGSMSSPISSGQSSRLNVGISLSILAREICERVKIYITAGNDWQRIHSTKKIANRRGFALQDLINREKNSVGGGGIFTRQCLEFIRQEEREDPDRIIVFSDSQDCDLKNKIPNPFGKTNYIIDVSSHTHGVNYSGVWTAEISGWSESFLNYIASVE